MDDIELINLDDTKLPEQRLRTELRARIDQYIRDGWELVRKESSLLLQRGRNMKEIDSRGIIRDC